MPNVLSHLSEKEQAEAVDALVAFLSTKQVEYPELKAGGLNPLEFQFWTKGDRERGKRLYHAVGCVACHAPDASYEVTDDTSTPLDRLFDELDPEELAEMGLAGAARKVNSVPHGDLAQKYNRLSLTHFLHDPTRTRPSGRMPDLKLTPNESADIAEYLLSSNPMSNEPIRRCSDEQLIAKGGELFAELGCANCHQVGVAPTLVAVPLKELDSQAIDHSCLASGAGAAASYPLDREQTAAIQQTLDPTHRQSGVNPVHLTMLQMNCYACHERDGVGGVGRFRKPYFETTTLVDLGDEGRLPPPLSGIGRKLKPAWINKVIRGDKGTRLRPHMTIRMPKYAHRDVSALSKQIGVVDQADRSSIKDVFGGEEPDAVAGQSLMEIGCIQCHAFDGQTLPGVVGVELTTVPGRVYPAWFRDFILDPASIKSRTRMPTFFPDGKSQTESILGGDALRQIASMWDYLDKHKAIGGPPKIARELAKDYQLTPSSQPLMLRTFMNGVGTHAIAVGFPEGIHFAFDANDPRLAVGWREDFIDARSTWFERFAPFVDPIGNQSTNINESGIVFGSDPVTRLRAVFRGYTLDADGVPTFEYQCGQLRVHDRITAVANQGLRRVLTIESIDQSPQSVYLKIIDTEGSQRVDPRKFRSGDGMAVIVSRKDRDQIRKEATPSGQHWMLPIDTPQTVDWMYQW